MQHRSGMHEDIAEVEPWLHDLLFQSCHVDHRETMTLAALRPFPAEGPRNRKTPISELLQCSFIEWIRKLTHQRLECGLIQEPRTRHVVLQRNVKLDSGSQCIIC